MVKVTQTFYSVFTNDQGTRFICWEHASYGTWDTDRLRDIQIHRHYWNEPHPSIVYIHVCVCVCVGGGGGGGGGVVIVYH